MGRNRCSDDPEIDWKDLKIGQEKYHAYLASREWATKRLAVIERACGDCEKCGIRKIRSVHHQTYIRLYNEKLEDLLGLCDECHSKIHKPSPIAKQPEASPVQEDRVPENWLDRLPKIHGDEDRSKAQSTIRLIWFEACWKRDEIGPRMFDSVSLERMPPNERRRMINQRAKALGNLHHIIK